MLHGSQWWSMIQEQTHAHIVDATKGLHKRQITRMASAQMSMPIAHHIHHIRSQ